MCTTPLTLKKAINITFTLYLNCLTFLGLGDVVLFHLRLCLLVSGLYSNIHDSSLVTTPSTSPVQFLVVPGCHDALKHAALFGPCSTNVRPFWHRSFSSPSLPNDCLYSLPVHLLSFEQSADGHHALSASQIQCSAG